MTSVQEFTNSNLTTALPKQHGLAFLKSKDLLPGVRALTPVEQREFLEKVDQVCRIT